MISYANFIQGQTIYTHQPLYQVHLASAEFHPLSPSELCGLGFNRMDLVHIEIIASCRCCRFHHIPKVILDFCSATISCCKKPSENDCSAVIKEWTWSLKQAVAFKRCSVGSKGAKVCQKKQNKHPPQHYTNSSSLNLSYKARKMLALLFMPYTQTLPSASHSSRN